MVASSPAIRSAAPANPSPISATNVLYTATSWSEAPCTSMAGDLTGGALVTVNPRPTAAVSGGGTICGGRSTNIQATLTGLGPGAVTWSDGLVQIASSSPAIRVVSPASTTAYSLPNPGCCPPG